MKKQILLILILILCSKIYAQVSFEKGYYINNSNQRIDCYIKNYDWKNNPTQIEYKLTKNSEVKMSTLNSIKEFSIDKLLKYIRYTVKIDRSSEKINLISYEKKPIFKEEVLFLKVLVEGKSNLYEYVDKDLKRYFYNTPEKNIEQLIYKSYTTKNNQIGTNNRFRNQLWSNLKCSTFTDNTYENLNYKKQSLIRFFVKYNQCNNEAYTEYGKKQKRDLFNLNLRPGLNYSSLSILETKPNITTNFGNKLSFRFGVEAEFILPFNRNKWALIIEPTYQYYKSEVKPKSEKIEANYSSIEIPIGVRHYFFLNNKSAFFINGAIVFDVGSQNSIIAYEKRKIFENENGILFKKAHNTLALGLGYKHNDKYSIELKYNPPREVLNGLFQYWRSRYKTFSIIFGYSLL